MIKLKDDILINYFHDGIYRYEKTDFEKTDSFAYVIESIIVIKNNKKIEEYRRMTHITNKDEIKYSGVKLIHNPETNNDVLFGLTETESNIQFHFLDKTAIFLYKNPNLTAFFDITVFNRYKN